MGVPQKLQYINPRSRGGITYYTFARTGREYANRGMEVSKPIEAISGCIERFATGRGCEWVFVGSLRLEVGSFHPRSIHRHFGSFHPNSTTPAACNPNFTSTRISIWFTTETR